VLATSPKNDCSRQRTDARDVALSERLVLSADRVPTGNAISYAAHMSRIVCADGVH
jgi:hypothetical protein